MKIIPQDVCWVMITSKTIRLIAVDFKQTKRIRCCSESNSANRIRWAMKKNPDTAIVVDEFMFVLMILGKIKETRLTFSQGSVTVLQKMENYEKAGV